MSATQRVFVALWPPPSVRGRLADVATNLAALAPGGRPVPAANLHLTLAFIGSLGVDRIADLGASIERAGLEPFVWRIDRLGAFDRARVLWAGGEPNAALEAFAQRMRGLLDRLGVAYDRKPFAAHVTLIRAARILPTQASAIDPPIDWPCQRATLVRSMGGPGGAIYRPLTGI